MFSLGQSVSRQFHPSVRCPRALCRQIRIRQQPGRSFILAAHTRSLLLHSHKTQRSEPQRSSLVMETLGCQSSIDSLSADINALAIDQVSDSATVIEANRELPTTKAMFAWDDVSSSSSGGDEEGLPIKVRLPKPSDVAPVIDEAVIRLQSPPISQSDHTDSPECSSVSDPHLSNPYKQWEKPPIPSDEYLAQANVPSIKLSAPRRLLLVLDLNGTLLLPTNSGAGLPRYGLSDFLRYVSRNHTVMIWSSARPEKVAKRCNRIFTSAGLAVPLLVWSRMHFNLPKEAYHDKVQVHKRLSTVWNDATVKVLGWDVRYDQTNTVLIDDSVLKAASEPFNHILVEEATRDRNATPDLGLVAMYLEEARWQSNVSNFIKNKPYCFDARKAATFKWNALHQSAH